MPRLILCADDFAMTAGVSGAILDLIDAGRLTATGAMTNRPHWNRLARDLAARGAVADLGVHLNLTAGAPLGAMPVVAPGGTLPPLGRLAKAALLSAQARAEIAAELGRQLDAFEQEAGRQPDFIDGHQHAHVLPGVRGALLAEIAARYPRGSVYVRDPADSPLAIAARGVAAGKALTVAALSFGFGRGARGLGIPTNDSFAGFSPFDPARDFAADFARFLMAAKARHLVMVHPGAADDAELAGLDPVAATRPVERDFLAGPMLPQLLAGVGMAPGRFQDARRA